MKKDIEKSLNAIFLNLEGSSKYKKSEREYL